MKLLVFAHTPPPHHGQSLMVQYMVEGFRADPSLGIEVVHVNARFSAGMEDVGRVRAGKFFALLGYLVEALKGRVLQGARVMYYVPSPPKRNSLIRDWLILSFCRLFFRKVVFHWHAAGLGEWLERPENGKLRRLSHLVLDRPALSICLSEFNISDARLFNPLKIATVTNGMPDPCPDYEQSLAGARSARSGLIRRALAPGGESLQIQLLFLAHCTREKGLFDAVNGVALANRRLRSMGCKASFQLNVAGEFMDPGERSEFEALVESFGADIPLRLHGFVTGASKQALFREADALCFPTFYSAENSPLVIAEAFAFGLPVVTTRWRSLPEFFDKDYPGLVAPHSPQELAEALLKVFAGDYSNTFRKRFLERYEVKGHLNSLATAIRGLESESSVGSSVSLR